MVLVRLTKISYFEFLAYCLYNSGLAYWYPGVEDVEDTVLFLKILSYSAECQAWGLIYSRDSSETTFFFSLQRQNYMLT